MLRRVFVKSTGFIISDVIIGCAAKWKVLLRLFLLNPKYYQNEIWASSSELYKHF